MLVRALVFAASLHMILAAQSLLAVPRDPTPGTTACSQSPQSTAQQLYQQGACLIQKGQWDQAAASFRSYTQLAPNDFRGWLMLSRAELHAKRFAQAHDDVLKAIARDGNSVEAYRTLGEIELELHDNEAAYKAWLKAHDLDPKDERVDYYLGRLFFEAEFWNEAAAWLRQAIALDPNDFAAMTYLGMAAERLAFVDTAIKLYRAAIDASKKQNKPYSWAYLAYAKHLHEQGNDEQALPLLEEAEKLCPEPHALTLLGQLLATKQPDTAEAILTRALSMDNSIPEAHYRLAMLLRSKGDEADAQKQFEEFRKTRATEDSKAKVQAIRK